MADSKGKAKRNLISLSSSEEEDELETEEEDDDYDENNSFSSSSGDEIEEEEEVEEEGSDSDDNDRTENDESLCNLVIALLKEGGELESLSLKQCKAYLRIRGLRITGTKAVCQQRILEHWRIKDGKAEGFYPRSSFSINCTGDVCKGDVVLFTQKVYEKFNKVKRHGRLLGSRTVAGRVVKESYGKAKQQHTFTVEVLWSKGTKKFPPLFPLLVKGRNLYKLKTYRQRWSSEAERRNVLAEKHRRGKAARLVKAMKETRKWSTIGTKHQKHLHQSRPSKKRKATEPERGKIDNARGKASIPRCANISNNYQANSFAGMKNQNSRLRVSNTSYSHQKPVHLTEVIGFTRHSYAGMKKQNSRLRISNTCYSHKKPVHLTEDIGASQHSYAGPVLNSYQSQTNFHQRSASPQFTSYDMGSTSTMVRSLPFRPYIDLWTIPASQYQGFNHHNYTHCPNSNPGFCNR
ncbi:uncharacterized protein LOC111291702 isoform X1 [Durio zibethinus]|uniref:Uncharacterized protein LOC111291702 isoform X1 n=1 Tax=Durio zibethinus TaxID=66656 RepID=A0A6P5YG43_DURZI|nr:uncharacterized protein LOC111291702 isoform X1 [Durio zibethinus]